MAHGVPGIPTPLGLEHQAPVPGEAQLGKAQHGVVGGHGGSLVPRRFRGRGGQDAHQGRLVVNIVGGLLGQAPGVGAGPGGTGCGVMNISR